MLGAMHVGAKENDGSRRVKLAGVGVEVSRLGFGTSALMSRVNRRDSLRLLGTAFEQGITHFDTARSYGFGEAESVLGEFLESRREAITVTTKVGILPPRRAPWLSTAKAAARALINAVPAARKHVRQGAARLLPAPRFDTAAMTISLETSLRALRTSYVDFLLLHEPGAAVLGSDEAFGFLSRMREQGKAKFTGQATNHPATRFASEMDVEARVLQQPYANLSETPKHTALDAAFLHSCLSAFPAPLKARIKADKSLAAEWSRSLDVDILESGKLEQLILLRAMSDMPWAAILFTSTQAQHIRENAAALRAAASLDQVERFKDLVRSHGEEG